MTGEKYLPIGSVCLLKEATRRVMITGFLAKGDSSEKVYDYVGCIYPEGILDSNMVCAFDHHQIEKICHMGYKTEQQEELSKILNGGYEIYKKKYENEAE